MDVGSIQANVLTAAAAPEVPTSIQKEQREMIHAVKAINATELFGQDNELTFVLDRETRRPLVRIVDKKTRQVVRQIPPEYALRMAEDLKLAFR